MNDTNILFNQDDLSRTNITLASLSTNNQWVAWKEQSNKQGKPTKVPKNPHSGDDARIPTDPSTYGTLDEAIARKQMINGIGGVGIVLGSVNNDYHLVGIDLDSCRAEETIADWALEIIERFDTYAEISPSQSGIKLFFLMRNNDWNRLHEFIGRKTRKPFSAGEHKEVAIDTARFYAVTAQRLETSPVELRVIPFSDVEWFVTVAGVNYLARHYKANGKGGGNGSAPHQRDESGSGYGFRFMRDCHNRGMSQEDAIAAIRMDSNEAGEWARRSDQRQLERAYDNAAEPDQPQQQQDTAAELPPEYSEIELSERFTERYAAMVRYVAEWKKWVHWTGIKWEILNVYAYDFARQIAREASIELKESNQRAATIVASNRVVAAIESLARKNIAHLSRANDFDADDWLLNTPRGIITLHDGKLIPHDSKYMMTKMTAVTPDFEMPTPMWDNFLNTTLHNDPVMIGFIQRLMAYCLTGSTREEIIIFIYGPGGTGKTTFMETIATIMGDYATVAVIESLTQRKNTISDRHSTDIAKLRGARLARAAETEEGRYWSAAKIKELSGGDTVTARLCHQDNADFKPKCKLTFHGNCKPKVRNPEGIRRRLLMIDFDHKIGAGEENKTLKEDLQAEAPGILAWTIRGCVNWQKEGLCPPQKVVDTTTKYFEEQEIINHWLEENCEITGDKNHQVKSSVLYNNYTEWCKEAGEEHFSQKDFSIRLENLGVIKKKTKAANFFLGIRGLWFEAILSDSPRFGD
jgi:putative DNA primase/helicase